MSFQSQLTYAIDKWASGLTDEEAREYLARMVASELDSYHDLLGEGAEVTLAKLAHQDDLNIDADVDAARFLEQLTTVVVSALGKALDTLPPDFEPSSRRRRRRPS